jgi:dipeptidyl aminopeptidase/acylaminoacyl peptidase
VAISPVTDWVSQHYTSNIGYFDQIFLQDDPTNAVGRYITRSSITYASRIQTPTLLTAGAADRCTPPAQAEEFYRALIEHGVTSELVLYPGEGHGVSSFPAVIDFNTRIVGWFERFMPAQQ